jgi:hypothetical protein
VKEMPEAETITAAAGKRYTGACSITAAVQIGIEPHIAGTYYDICIPVETGKQSEITSHVNGKCVYLKRRNIVICLMEKTPYPAINKDSKGEAVFHNSWACKVYICRCTAEHRGLRYR